MHDPEMLRQVKRQQEKVLASENAKASLEDIRMLRHVKRLFTIVLWQQHYECCCQSTIVKTLPSTSYLTKPLCC
jgi:hypothetical protein